MDIEPEFDLNKALTYIADFLPTRLPLETDGSDIEGVNINPTLGQIPLALAEVIIYSKKPQRILEIGTSVAETTIALGYAAKTYGGEVTTVEINRRIASAAIRNIQHADIQESVRLSVGDGANIISQFNGPFGFIIQDGAKNLYVPMLERLIDLMEPGGILLSDDVLFPIMFDNPRVKELDDYNHALRDNSRLKTVWLPIGDGVALSTRI
ncbi:class I SAM-dependent methyltransferase [bacterium]|nr:class I SAM-dependent methyltransferase [bacterium]